MGDLQFQNLKPIDIKLGNGQIQRVYAGVELVWALAEAPPPSGDPAGPKIDPNHALANQEYMVRLVGGELMGMENVSNHAIVDGAYASAVAGTVSFLREPLVSTPNGHMRITARVKVDKTSGRFSFVGFSSVATPTTSSPDVMVGHTAGSGIQVRSFNFALNLNNTVLSEAQCVDGAWYDVTLTWSDVGYIDQRPASDTSNAGPNRAVGTALPLDPANNPADVGSGVNWFMQSDGSKLPPTNKPLSLIARTNSPLGTIKDLHYANNMLAPTAPLDNGLVFRDGKMMDYATEPKDMFWVWSKAKAAPLRIILTAGGSGTYGGIDFSAHFGRSGHPYVAWRKLWRDLADLGYTVLHTHAWHEGWGADVHLQKQLEAYNLFNTQFLLDARLYYIGYSLGGASLWRALMGRAGFPPLRAAYCVAGISNIGMFWDNAMMAQIQQKWPGGVASIDEPQSWDPADLIARGTRVRMVTSTTDENVPKATHHDPMFAKFAGSGLASELVHQGISHFDPQYWDAQDIVNFFENQDLGA